MNMKKIKNSIRFSLFLLSALFCFNTTLYPVNGPIPGMPEMSEADMQKFMSELESTAKEIDNFVSSLPPEEQAEFNKAVQEVEQMINEMDPEELEKFIGNMFGGADAQEEPKEQIEEPVTKPIEKEKTPELTKKELSEQEKALEMINNLIKKTESFMVKVQANPELVGRVKRWGTQGKIRNWQADFTWDTVKTGINRFIQKLYKIKEQDPKTNQYKFLQDFIKDKALYNNLNLLLSTLNQYESKIEISAFGIEKISAKDKNAIQQILSGYTESMYVLKTPESLNTIIAKYEPRAKELAEEEKKIEERAITESRRRPRPGRTEVGGMSEEEEAFYGGDYGAYDDYGYNSGGYSPSFGGASPSYTPSPSVQTAAPGQPGAARTGVSGQQQAGIPTTAAPGTEGITTAPQKKDQAQPSKEKTPSSDLKTIQQRAQLENRFNDIEYELGSLIKQIDDNTLLSGDIKKNIQQEKTIGELQSITQGINDIASSITKLEKDQIYKLKSQAKVPATRKAYKQRLEKIFSEIKVDKKTVQPKQKLNEVVAQLDTIEDAKKDAPLNNQYAYFGDLSGFEIGDQEQVASIMEKEQKGEALTAQEQKIKAETEQTLEKVKNIQTINPISLPKLKDTINGLLNSIDNFDKEERADNSVPQMPAPPQPVQ